MYRPLLKQPLRTFVMAVAGIAGAMKTETAALQPSSADLLGRCLGAFVLVLQKAVLPHLAAGFGLFLLLSYVAYINLLAPFHLRGWTLGICACLVFGFYAFVTFFYALITACLFALRLACVAWDDFIGEMLDKIKDKMLARLDNVQDGIAKDQAKIWVRGSVREVLQAETRHTMALPKWVMAVFLGVLTLALRSVLVARIVKASGTTIKLTKIFAGKATLIGAVFLNLRFFATVLLGAAYIAGGTVFVLNIMWCLY